jgi:hypothetical protein
MEDPMKADIKTRWLEALRSGRYTQAKGALRKDALDGTPAFCCLGVLCELWLADHPLPGWQSGQRILKTGGTPEQVGEIMGEDNFLPDEVQEWAGLDSRDGEFDNDEGEMSNLAELNDDGRDFAFLADIIEDRF